MTWITVVATSATGIWTIHLSHSSAGADAVVPVHARSLYAAIAVNLLLCCVNSLTLFDSIARRTVTLPPAVQAAWSVASLAAGGLFVGALGGVRGPFWPVLVPSVLLAGLSYAVVYATVLGLVADVILLAATVAGMHGSLSAATLAAYAAAAPVLPLLGMLTATVSGSIAQMAALAARERDLVTAHVRAVAGTLEAAAHGNLAVEVPQPADGANPSMFHLSSMLERTLADLRRLVSHVRRAGEQVGSAAAELLATAEQHAASAAQQSTAMTETTTTIEELAATARQIAETAEAVARFAAETFADAEDGQQAVTASVSSIEAIGGSVEAMARRTAALGERTAQIGTIVAVIDDLAEQTNLLALNAAIEAARAGDHGRGFAVVATEIRALAERARDSTQQIDLIVGEVQAQTRDAIIASEAGANETRSGVQLARDVAAALDRIRAMVDETTTAATEISIATQQRRSASEQVVVAMNQVSDAARQYATGSQQTAASASQLHALANQLREAIGHFTVDDDRGTDVFAARAPKAALVRARTPLRELPSPGPMA
ncbi:methyl-accepting chemotaxis protein [Humibacter sp.]|uniref:methyl-accepting chemotaxis protein n=1 Tax=Humibacter sp. TaxID=1940291 RepID=UPI002C3901CE|nr:methyl-accepting chemotaxis protein [Humibacter sp.]HVX09173.1 methyl-accepting chemotaxis protein [Humibacter sp.]